MNEPRQFFGVILMFAGFMLLVAPLVLLDTAAGPGAGGSDILPLLQALGAIAGGVVALILAWFLLRRF
jgi:hypothetical protein